MAQGYCSVCRQHWLLPEGEDCPKHEIRLSPIPPEIVDLPIADGEVPSWATVASFDHALEAEGPRLRLEWEGIPTFLDGVRMAGHSGGAAGGVRLQVPATLVVDARDVLATSWELDEDEETDATSEDDLDRDANSSPHPARKNLLWRALGVFIAVIFVRGLAAILGL